MNLKQASNGQVNKIEVNFRLSQIEYFGRFGLLLKIRTLFLNPPGSFFGCLTHD